LSSGNQCQVSNFRPLQLNIKSKEMCFDGINFLNILGIFATSKFFLDLCDCFGNAVMCFGCCYLCKKCCCDDDDRRRQPAVTHQTIVVHQPAPGQFQQPMYDPMQQQMFANQQQPMYDSMQQQMFANQQQPMYNPSQPYAPNQQMQQQQFYPNQSGPPPAQPGWNAMPQPYGGAPPQQPYAPQYPH
jgi:hypothetical protein